MPRTYPTQDGKPDTIFFGLEELKDQGAIVGNRYLWLVFRNAEHKVAAWSTALPCEDRDKDPKPVSSFQRDLCIYSPAVMAMNTQMCTVKQRDQVIYPDSVYQDATFTTFLRDDARWERGSCSSV